MCDLRQYCEQNATRRPQYGQVQQARRDIILCANSPPRESDVALVGEHDSTVQAKQGQRDSLDLAAVRHARDIKIDVSCCSTIEAKYHSCILQYLVCAASQYATSKSQYNEYLHYHGNR